MQQHGGSVESKAAPTAPPQAGHGEEATASAVEAVSTRGNAPAARD
jgi:hypothetical protein